MTEQHQPSLLVSSYALLALALSSSTAVADAVRATPWLAGVTHNSVYVSTEVDGVEPAVVDYGTTAAYGSQQTSEYIEPTVLGNGVHNIKLTGLLPNTQYHYRVTHGASVSADHTFWTAPEPGTPAHWGFAADSRSQTAIHDAMAGLILGQQPHMMVYGGDLCHYGRSYDAWNDEWFVPNQEALNATAPWVNATGNHESWTDLTRAFTQSPAGDSPYFSFDYGDSHILILNNELPYDDGSPQWDFAASDLAGSTATWNVVAFHQSAYVAGSVHGEDPGMIAMTQQIFEPNGVDLVMTGHSHFYQHNLVNGIHHVVLGTIAAPLYTPYSASYTVYSEQTYCFGIVDTTPWNLTLTAYRQDGSVIEVTNIGELPGDVNDDGTINGLDVDPFVNVLLNGTDDNATQFRADMNGDGDVNGLDVDPFATAVVGSGTRAVPEPPAWILATMALLGLILATRKTAKSMPAARAR